MCCDLPRRIFASLSLEKERKKEEDMPYNLPFVRNGDLIQNQENYNAYFFYKLVHNGIN